MVAAAAAAFAKKQIHTVVFQVTAAVGAAVGFINSSTQTAHCKQQKLFFTFSMFVSGNS